MYSSSITSVPSQSSLSSRTHAQGDSDFCWLYSFATLLRRSIGIFIGKVYRSPFHHINYSERELLNSKLTIGNREGWSNKIFEPAWFSSDNPQGNTVWSCAEDTIRIDIQIVYLKWKFEGLEPYGDIETSSTASLILMIILYRLVRSATRYC